MEQRSAQIAAEADPTIAEFEETLGRDLTKSEKAVVTKTAVLKTRAAKESASSVSVLHARWRAEAASLGWDATQLHSTLTSIATPIVTPDSPVDPALFAAAVLAAGRRHGVFSRADLTIEVAARLPNLAATAEQTMQAVEQITSRGLSGGRGCAVNLGSQRTDVTP
jgi:hypothetical protein